MFKVVTWLSEVVTWVVRGCHGFSGGVKKGCQWSQKKITIGLSKGVSEDCNRFEECFSKVFNGRHELSRCFRALSTGLTKLCQGVLRFVSKGCLVFFKSW